MTYMCERIDMTSFRVIRIVVIFLQTSGLSHTHINVGFHIKYGLQSVRFHIHGLSVCISNYLDFILNIRDK